MSRPQYMYIKYLNSYIRIWPWIGSGSKSFIRFRVMVRAFKLNLGMENGWPSCVWVLLQVPTSNLGFRSGLPVNLHIPDHLLSLTINLSKNIQVFRVLRIQTYFKQNDNIPIMITWLFVYCRSINSDRSCTLFWTATSCIIWHGKNLWSVGWFETGC